MKNPAADHHQIDLHTRNEFSVKVAVANTKRNNFVASSRLVISEEKPLLTTRQRDKKV